MQRVTFPSEDQPRPFLRSAMTLVALAFVGLAFLAGRSVGHLHAPANEAGVVLAQLHCGEHGTVTVSELRSKTSDKRWIFGTVSRGSESQRYLLYVDYTGSERLREIRCERAGGQVAYVWLVSQTPWHTPAVAGALDLVNGVCFSGISSDGRRTQCWVEPANLSVGEAADCADGLYFGWWHRTEPPVLHALPNWATVSGGEALKRLL